MTTFVSLLKRVQFLANETVRCDHSMKGLDEYIGRIVRFVSLLKRVPFLGNETLRCDHSNGSFLWIHESVNVEVFGQY